MDHVIDYDLFEMINGFLPTITTTTTTLTNIPSNNNPMLDDWGIDAMVASFTTTTFTPTITTTTTTPVNNNQMLNDWGLDAASINPTFISTPANNNQMMASDWGLDNTPVILHNNNNNYQPLDHYCWKMTNSSSTSVVTPTTHAWNQHALMADGSLVATTASSTPSSMLGAPTTNQQNSRNTPQGEIINLHQPLMNSNNIKQLMMQNPTLNVPKTPTLNSNSTKNNWPILTIPCYGKLTDKTPTHKQLHQEISKHDTNNVSQSASDSSDQRKSREKRIYKMPLAAVKNDVWSWRKYGEKSVDGSPYPRVYYKCNSTKKCAAKRRVEQNRYDPDFAILKYTGHHNHPMPTLMKSAITNPTSSSAATNNNPNSLTNSKINNKNDRIFEGLENLVDLEKST